MLRLKEKSIPLRGSHFEPPAPLLRTMPSLRRSPSREGERVLHHQHGVQQDLSSPIPRTASTTTIDKVMMQSDHSGNPSFRNGRNRDYSAWNNLGLGSSHHRFKVSFGKLPPVLPPPTNKRTTDTPFCTFETRVEGRVLIAVKVGDRLGRRARDRSVVECCVFFISSLGFCFGS